MSRILPKPFSTPQREASEQRMTPERKWERASSRRVRFHERKRASGFHFWRRITEDDGKPLRSSHTLPQTLCFGFFPTVSFSTPKMRTERTTLEDTNTSSTTNLTTAVFSEAGSPQTIKGSSSWWFIADKMPCSLKPPKSHSSSMASNNFLFHCTTCARDQR